MKLGKRSFQFVWWPHPDAWHLTIWRWPNANVLERTRALGISDFGFYGFCLGPVELRYWPNYGKTVDGQSGLKEK